LSLQALDRLRRALLDDATLDRPTVEPIQGAGSGEDPFVVDRIPFNHTADTREIGQDRFDRYPECDDGEDESGPEVVYRLELREEQALRMMVFSAEGADLDIHLLGSRPEAERCLYRDGRMIQRTLAPGIYYITVDSFNSRRGGDGAGEYFLLIVPCVPGDPACGRRLSAE
jgi:hypothetical protein